MQPAQLAARLQGPAAAHPLVLHVGFRVLYAEAHIPDSEYVGPASEEDGLQRLSERVANLPRDAAIVIYCGCCPWMRCPNVAAAYERLRSQGFTAVRVLYIARNFGQDWAEQGYAVARTGT